MPDYTYYASITKNGSAVRIKEWTSPGTAWSCGTIHRTIFIDKLNDDDYKLIEALGLPRWYFDFTGRGMTFSDSDSGKYVLSTQLKALEIQRPWQKVTENK